MAARDLPAVVGIAEEVHPDYPEEEHVFAERLALFPDGCRLLVERGEALGYLISHPWSQSSPPALDTRLGTIPDPASTYYIHDLALMPSARGRGLAADAIAAAAACARKMGCPSLSLVAVGNSLGFWEAQGFVTVSNRRVEQALASYGGGACYMERPAQAFL